MRDKYLAGGIGTYTRPSGGSSTWTKQGSSGGEGEGGTFTLTGIPSQYNGKYALLAGEDQATGVNIGGFQSANISTSTYTLCLISNGSVSIPMWNDVSNGNVVRYSGNATCVISVALFNTQTVTGGGDMGSLMIGGIAFLPITFTNGSATRAWSQGQVITP